MPSTLKMLPGSANCGELIFGQDSAWAGLWRWHFSYRRGDIRLSHLVAMPLKFCNSARPVRRCQCWSLLLKFDHLNNCKIASQTYNMHYWYYLYLTIRGLLICISDFWLCFASCYFQVSLAAIFYNLFEWLVSCYQATPLLNKLPHLL